MVRLFGTDGVRGVAGEDLTGQLAMDVARAAGALVRREPGLASQLDHAQHTVHRRADLMTHVR